MPKSTQKKYIKVQKVHKKYSKVFQSNQNLPKVSKRTQKYPNYPEVSIITQMYPNIPKVPKGTQEYLKSILKVSQKYSKMIQKSI